MPPTTVDFAATRIYIAGLKQRRIGCLKTHPLTASDVLRQIAELLLKQSQRLMEHGMAFQSLGKVCLPRFCVNGFMMER